MPIVALIALLAFSGSASAHLNSGLGSYGEVVFRQSARQQVPHNPTVGCNRPVRAAQGVGLAQKVWAPSRWHRGDPKPAAVRAHRRQVECAAGPGHRKAIRHYWRIEKRIYFRHRHRKIGEREYLAAITPPGPAVLAAIRACESGGDYSTATGNGFWGAYQFTLSAWASVGGSGLPSDASPREQDERAARLYREEGSSPWPVCGV